MKKFVSVVFWFLVSLAGAFAYVTLALRRNEQLNSVFILTAALCTYAIGYRFYSKWIAARIMMLDDRRATPCEVNDDGRDFVKTNKWIVFGHHFAAISGPGPLVGPVLAAQFGYLPGTLWILIGVVLGGAVQDFIILFCSMRRNGKSLAQMVKEELNSFAGVLGLIAILAIMIILLAVLALVVVNVLAESPWGVFTVGATIPIAMIMGGYLRWVRVGKVLEGSIIGVVLLLLAVKGGQVVHEHADWSKMFSFGRETIAWTILGYALAASVLPVWLLLAPRDYLSTFMKLGTIAALAAGCFLVLPTLKMPAITTFINGSGLVFAGKLFPFCFITIACGAISGFHTLISSGVTPKIITRESYARPVGYGAMCLESLVAIMAMIAACTLDPGIYLSMNVKGAGATAQAVAADTIKKVEGSGFKIFARENSTLPWQEAPVKVSPAQMDQLAVEMGEKTLYGRAGGAATLAVGMAQIFGGVTGGRWLDLWYHFAIMFEALFILTTLDAGTRVGRYLLQDVLGSVWAPLADTKNIGANALASLLVVAGWGCFLIQGVRDPLGGINSLWPLFGIANQLLASIALCLATTIILKMMLKRSDGSEATPQGSPRHPAYALVTLVPLIWLLTVTMTAGVQKIFHEDPKIGFLSAMRQLDKSLPTLQQALANAAPGTPSVTAAQKAINDNRTLHFNNLLDAATAGIFLVLVGLITVVCLWEWALLIAGKKLAKLCETTPVLLPEYAVAEGKPLRLFAFFALMLALAKELSGEAEMARAQKAIGVCDCTKPEHQAAQKQIYAQVVERRFDGIKRCC
jgi:carbon starvation protein